LNIDIYFLFFQYITNEGSKVFFRTNKNAPNYQVIAIDFNKPEEENWETLIAVSFICFHQQIRLFIMYLLFIGAQV